MADTSSAMLRETKLEMEVILDTREQKIQGRGGEIRKRGGGRRRNQKRRRRKREEREGVRRRGDTRRQTPVICRKCRVEGADGGGGAGGGRVHLARILNHLYSDKIWIY